jgi:hypothetical protein
MLDNLTNLYNNCWKLKVSNFQFFYENAFCNVTECKMISKIIYTFGIAGLFWQENTLNF